LEDRLRPWRAASAAISLIQIAATLVVFAVVFLAGDREQRWAFVAAGATVILEAAQLAIARRAPRSAAAERYAAAPLDPGQRNLVRGNLAATVSAPVLLPLLLPTALGTAAAILLLLVASMPAALGLVRVLRRNSWLAISRLPARPRGADGR
jgi:hypothetical protein